MYEIHGGHPTGKGNIMAITYYKSATNEGGAKGDQIVIEYGDNTFAREFGESGFNFSPIKEGSELYIAIIKTAKVL